jgi:ABC-type nitrate/sulfonate/bicarbonate transport system permease component
MIHYLFKSLPVVVVLIVWQVLVKFELISGLYFPAPLNILKQLFFLLFNDSSFSYGIVMSSYRLFIGALVSIPSAILVALAIHLNRYIALFLEPLIAITYPIPKLAIFPLLLVIFGIEDMSKIAIIAIGIFFLVLLNTLHGLQRIAKLGYFDIVKIYKIPFLYKIFNVMIKGVFPDILTGIKVGMGYGLVMVVAGEFTVSKDGIGFFMWNAWDQFRITDLYCGLFILSLMGLIFFYTLDFIHNKFHQYREEM